MGRLKNAMTKVLGPKAAPLPTVGEVIDAHERMVAGLEAEVARLERSNRVLTLQNARLGAERVLLQELARSLQNINQSQSMMLGDVIHNSAGLLTDESVQESVKMLALTVKQIVPTAVEDVIQRVALADPRTQGVIAASSLQLADRARVVNDE